MDNEIELISDGEGLAVIGDPTAVERFLAAEKLPSTELVFSHLRSATQAGAAVAVAGSEMAANSGRWVKLTKESAQAAQKYGMTPTKTPGVSHAMIGDPGSIRQWMQITDGPGSLVSMTTNPAMLAGAAGLMSQLAMQQAMAEITDYLARIDEKLDDVLRAQTNQVMARMDGVDLAVKEAMSVRNSVGRVSEVTWSKVQHSSGAILETQGYALRQLADLADKLEDKARVDELVKVARQAETDVRKWLAVLARCFQLHDAVAVLELDRVLDADPHELDQHRLGLKAARQDRIGLIGDSTQRLLERMSVAAETANSKVLFNPIQSPAIVAASNHVAVEVHELHELLEIECGPRSAEARRWGEAAGEHWDKVRDAGAGSIDTAKNLSSETRTRAKSVKDKVSEKARGTGADGLDSAKHLGTETLGRARSMKGRLSRKKADEEPSAHEDDESSDHED